LGPLLRARICRFLAERFNFGQYDFGPNSVLSQNAANLPQVLDVLTANPARFDKLNAITAQILPQIRQVSIRPVANNKVEILVWPHNSASERADLAIPLNECGSGVGQVLAILYVVLTSDHPQTIVIDEPQNFLHPGAIRKLIQVLRQHPQHQYIMATHSPTVITASEPSTLFVLRSSGSNTSIESIDPSNEKQLETYLGEIGARLSDVFGADNILWVEGQTEELCFPLVLKGVANRALIGTAIIGVRRTGDFQGHDQKERAKILGAYITLSNSKTLLPKAIAFVFDEECLSEKEKGELRRLAPDLLHFLPRRMYENYLLDPEAVSVVANRIEGFRPQGIVAEEVQQLFMRKLEERDSRDPTGRQLLYFCKGTTVVPEDWERHVHAGNLLKDAFTELSEARVEYEKTKHSVAITEYLIRYKRERLVELSDWIVGLMRGQTA
jgi:hypothetical protein